MVMVQFAVDQEMLRRSFHPLVDRRPLRRGLVASWAERVVRRDGSCVAAPTGLFDKVALMAKGVVFEDGRIVR